MAVAQRCHTRITNIILPLRANQAVGRGDGAYQARGAINPGDGPHIQGWPTVPEVAAHDIVAVVQRCHAAIAYIIVGLHTDQAVIRPDKPFDTRAAITPGDGPGIGRYPFIVVPQVTAHDVVAIVQRHHAPIAYIIVWHGTDQAVGRRDGAHDPCGTVAPRHRPSLGCASAVHVGAAHDIVAVVQRHYTATANTIILGRTDQAVGGRDGPNPACRAIAPGDGPRIDKRTIVPFRAERYIVAVAQRHHAPLAQHVTRVGTDQAVGRRDGPSNASGAIAPR